METPDGYIDVTDAIRRRLIWDVIPCDMATEYIERLGLNPGTEEGNDLEHRDSHVRLNKLIPIEQVLRVTIALAGDVIARAILDTAGIEGPVKENPDYLQYQRVLNAGVIAVMANLLDFGAIEIGEEVRILL